MPYFSHTKLGIEMTKGDLVSFLVRTTMFIFEKDVIKSQKWMISEMIEADSSFDQYYLNTDPYSLGIIYSMMSGDNSPLKNLCSKGVSLLKSTAIYLGCDNFIPIISEVYAKTQEKLKKMANLRSS